ncbi:hypothetical protein ADIARSV_0128 [Arcticibacter svalbardensis MN12-7]|uniref:Uncharacterized protein n=1 Tax=Arcticibacter svalbardensis MN12-7 TaxID=1150600 RepID=R9GYZ9_9SPHI|nr:hypothetical protein ADIARSV_0128 [Arcticibacter svalbardensis MN12-7]
MQFLDKKPKELKKRILLKSLLLSCFKQILSWLTELNQTYIDKEAVSSY